MTSGWRRAILVGLAVGLVGPGVWALYAISGSDSEGFESLVTWTFPFWVLMFGTDGSTPSLYFASRLGIGILLNMILFGVLAVFARWLYARVVEGSSGEGSEP